LNKKFKLETKLKTTTTTATWQVARL